MYITVTDAHWGMNKGNTVMLNHLKDFFWNEILPLAKQDHIKGFIHLGDFVTSKLSLQNRISIEIDLFIGELSKYVECYFLIGNHDLIYENDMETHSLARFNNMNNVNVWLGGGELELDGRKVVYHSYNHSSHILNWLEENEISGDVYLSHTETDGYKIHKYVNKNFTFGLSGHIHTIEEHGNVTHVPSPQEHSRNESEYNVAKTNGNYIKGYMLVDFKNMTKELIQYTGSGQFKTVHFGTEYSKADIKGNYIDIEIDTAKVRELTSSPTNQNRLIEQFFTKIENMEPGIISRKFFKDSEDKTDQEIEFEDISDIKDLDFNDELFIRVEEIEMLHKEETVDKLKDLLNRFGGLE